MYFILMDGFYEDKLTRLNICIIQFMVENVRQAAKKCNFASAQSNNCTEVMCLQ